MAESRTHTYQVSSTSITVFVCYLADRQTHTDKHSCGITTPALPPYTGAQVLHFLTSSSSRMLCMS